MLYLSKNAYYSFDFTKLKIASPDRILLWSQRYINPMVILGEITTESLYNDDESLPHEDGLFSQKIFGPLISYTCKCKKYDFNTLKTTIPNFLTLETYSCETCFVELTDSALRKYRLGFINLITPIIHPWYNTKEKPYLKQLLTLIYPVYFESSINFLLEKPFTRIMIHLNENSMLYSMFTLLHISVPNAIFCTDMIFELLNNINLEHLLLQLRNKIQLTLNFEKDINNILYENIRFIESFILSETELSWLFLLYLPVLPPSLRENIANDDDQIITNSYINLYYQIIIKSIHSIFDAADYFASLPISTVLLNIHTTILIIDTCLNLLLHGTNIKLPKEEEDTQSNIISSKMYHTIINYIEKKLDQPNLQLNPLFDIFSQPLEFITHEKTGFIQQYVVGKRLNFSGRSVITVDPTLRLDQCKVPYSIIAEMLSILIFIKLYNKCEDNIFNIHTNIYNESIIYTFQSLFEEHKNQRSIFYWLNIQSILNKYNLLLNRAPSLHILNLQSFKSSLNFDNTIHLHPMLCSGFNADFDGDQMAVYLPIKTSSQVEIQSLMRPSITCIDFNGEFQFKPIQDMVLGCYYLTYNLPLLFNKTLLIFNTLSNAIQSYYTKVLNLHTPILINASITNIKIAIDPILSLIQLSMNDDIHEVKIVKILKYNIKKHMYCFITSIGIILGIINEQGIFSILKFLFETSVGRILFFNYYYNIIKKYDI